MAKQIGPAAVAFGLTASVALAADVLQRSFAADGCREYYLEWSSPGCNTWQLNEDLPGHACRDGEPRPRADVAMSIVEYAPAAGSPVRQNESHKGR